MTTRQQTVEVEGYRYGDRRIEDVNFKLIVSISDNSNQPLKVESVEPASQADLDRLVEAGQDYFRDVGSNQNIDEWCDEIYSDIQADIYIACEALDDANGISQTENDRIVTFYRDVYHHPDPKAFVFGDW